VKLHQAGALPKPDPTPAWARIDAWTLAGFTPAWIASACHLEPRTIETALAEQRAGHTRTLGAVITRRILAADITKGTAGRCTALPARRRLQALACHGYDTSRIQAASGLSFTTLAAIRRGATQTVTAAHHHQIAATYNELCETFGDSTTAKARATRLHWAPPWAWDNIADPTEHPGPGLPDADDVDPVAVLRAMAGEHVHLTPAERVAAITALAAQGFNDDQVATRVGVTARTVIRIRNTHHIPSRWAA
jgi:hypothetical protein